MVPFFVVDRPMSLNIVKSYFAKHSSLKFGLMTHAQTSDNFKKLYASFPCDWESQCWVPNCECPGSGKTNKNAVSIRNRVIKIVDSGIFRSTKERGSYKDIFSSYDEMNADYGIMIDFLKDMNKTLDSAKEALELYSKGKYNFKLITVAQGNNTGEYIECYRKLKELGSEFIAIGGLLNRKENSARYIHVRDESMMREVVESVCEAYNPEWLFALGVYHPSRHDFFNNQKVWGSDYKGWIFNYTHKLDLLQELQTELAGNEIEFSQDRVLKGFLTKRTNLFNHVYEYRKKWNLSKGNEKRIASKKIEELTNQCYNLDKIIFTRRSQLFLQKGIPITYKRKLLEAQKILESSEQEVRVNGVHKYFDINILPKMGISK